MLRQAEGRWLPLNCEDAFAGLKFWDPVNIVALPGGAGRMVVVERRGTVQLVEPRSTGFVKSEYLNIASHVSVIPYSAEDGLLGLAFHPDFLRQGSPHRGELFLYYSAQTPEGSTNRLSRFRMGGDRVDEFDESSEQILIDQPELHPAHNGGSLQFGPDGYLYLSLGDDFQRDPNPNCQTIRRNLAAGILRLDVDCRGGDISHPPPRQPRWGRTAGYFIPNNNPFVGLPDVLEEYYALGLRNPWRTSFDSVTGKFYVADVGERHREEINLIEPGSNCGWGYAEGSLLRCEIQPDAPDPPKDYMGFETWPLFEYSRDDAHRCIIGGYVYRGQVMPEFNGHYIYADQSGRIYALELTDQGRTAGKNRLVATLSDPGIGISSFGEGADGELYFCWIGQMAAQTGRIFRLRRTRTAERSQLPTSLAQTGLFTTGDVRRPAPGVVPYEVTVPLWSDSADKTRWISLPPGTTPNISVEGQMQFPAGTVFVKHFSLATDQRRPEVRRPLETRVLACDATGDVYGATYRWSPDGKSTQRVDTAESEAITVMRPDGQSHVIDWHYPGRFECMLCHNESSGQVLGFNLKQLHRRVSLADGSTAPQLDVLQQCGALPTQVTQIPEASIPRLARLDDKQAPLEQRVRSYLDVNCSMCHNPRRQYAAIDARIERPLGEQGLIDGESHYHKELGRDVRVVRPGDLSLSVLHLRVAAHDASLRMPPLGRTEVDEEAAAVVAAWIESLRPARGE
ncbi:MAG: PQQ-dependent sugar dehydrogenase [Planctomycetia bacterium]|nr:PQQ-dependent sugar dehydrogenase [Planctomycetia bacterium]